MKKTTLGLLAIGSLMIAGQSLISATPAQSTLLQGLAGYTGPIWFDVTGISESQNNQAVDGQNTWAVLQVQQIGKDSNYNNTINFGAETIYITVTGLTSIGIPDASTTEIKLQGGVMNMFESAAYLGTPEFLVDNLATLTNPILTGNLQPGVINDGTTTIYDSVNIHNSSGLHGTGYGFASVDLLANNSLTAQALDTDGFNTYFGGGIADFYFSFNFNPIDQNTPNFVGYSALTDPIEANVPEPTTMLLFGTGLIGLAGIGRKKLRE